MGAWEVSGLCWACLLLGGVLGYVGKDCLPHPAPELAEEKQRLELELYRLVAIETLAGKHLFRMARDGNREAQDACTECWPGVLW